MRRVRWLALVLGMTCLAGAAGAEDAPMNPYLDEPVPVANVELEPQDPYAETRPARPSRSLKPQVTTPAPAPVLAPENPYDEPTLLMAYAPIRAVAVMLETGQTLLWDEKDNVYRLGRVGEEIHGWRIMAVEADQVIVVQAGVREELPLTPAPTVKKQISSKKKVPPTIVVAVPEPERTETLERKAEPPVVAIPPEKVPVFTPAPAQAPPPAEPAKPIEQKMTLARAELDRELTDFDRLMAHVSVAEAKGGGFKLTRVDEKSYVHKIGLRAGDVVISVAGEQVSTVDDAARVYARLRTARSFAVELDRAGARVTLKYDVK